MKSYFRRVLVLILSVLFISTPALAQERTAIKQGFELDQNSNKKILVFRPTVRVGAQSTGGLFEPNAQWTDDARKYLSDALLNRKATLGNEVIFAPEPAGDDAIALQEHMALFATIAESVQQYQFFLGNRLPTKKRDNKNDVFDWSMGKTVASLPGAADADYGLFIYNEDHYGSTGRKLLQFAAFLTPGISIKSGVHTGHAGLIDLKTGDLLWLNSDAEMGGDVRNAEGAEKRVTQLLEGIPGSEIKATAK